VGEAALRVHEGERERARDRAGVVVLLGQGQGRLAALRHPGRERQPYEASGGEANALAEAHDGIEHRPRGTGQRASVEGLRIFGAAAAPQEEMGLSNSTLHWLEDGEQAVPDRLTEPGSMASYDPRAPVPDRRRAYLVVGIAGAIALFIAGSFYAQSVKRRAAEAPAATAVEPARDLTTRAEAALAANRLDEALELAHLALTADPRFADAHFVVASVEKARNQSAAARDEFRKYLELAPLGTHAAEARTGLSSLPP